MSAVSQRNHSGCPVGRLCGWPVMRLVSYPVVRLCVLSGWPVIAAEVEKKARRCGIAEGGGGAGGRFGAGDAAPVRERRRQQVLQPVRAQVGLQGRRPAAALRAHAGRQQPHLRALPRECAPAASCRLGGAHHQADVVARVSRPARGGQRAGRAVRQDVRAIPVTHRSRKSLAPGCWSCTAEKTPLRASFRNGSTGILWPR